MPNYSQSKIYTLVCWTTGKIYIGSTTQSLEQRLCDHRISKRKDYSSKKIIKNNNFEIILIENFPCNSKKELEFREGLYIRNNPCVNIKIAGRTRKEYYQDNRDKFLENRKQYHINNREKRLEYEKQYRDYQNTWGGDKRYNNNLLKIDINLFQ